MRGLGIGIGLSRGPSGPSYSAAAQSFFDLVTVDGGTIDADRKSVIDAWYVSSAAYRSKIKRLNAFVTDALTGMLVPMVRSGGAAKDTNHNFVSGDFNVASGLTGNGSSKYLDTGFDPAAEGLSSSSYGQGVYLINAAVVYDDTDCPIGTYNAAGDRSDIGFENAGAPFAIMKGSQGGAVGGTMSDIVSEDLVGLYSIAGQFPVDASSKVRDYVNGVPVGASATANAAWALPALGNVTPFALNLVGTPSRFWPGTMGAYVLFSGMTNAEHLAMHTDLHTLMQGLGRAP